MKTLVKGFLCLMILFSGSIYFGNTEVKAEVSKKTSRKIFSYTIYGYVEKVSGKAVCITSESSGSIGMWSSIYATFVSGGPQIAATNWMTTEARATLYGTGIPINVKGNHYAKGYDILVDWTTYF